MEFWRNRGVVLGQVFAPVSFVVLLGVSTTVHSADLLLQKVPPLTIERAPAYPENLARYSLGARIDSASGTESVAGGVQLSSMSEDKNTAVAALLCDDPTTGYALPAGKSTLVFSFPAIENVESISFLNRGAQGNVSIATSNSRLPAESSQWRSAAKQELGSETVNAKIGPTEAKYVRLTFDVSQPGRIAAFGLYATPAVSDFTMPRLRKASLDEKSQSLALITSNLTNVHLKARALYVSSGNDVGEANNMIDDQPTTSYAFSGSDLNPTAVVDLGKVCSLQRLSAIYMSRKGTVDFYVLETLPTGTGQAQLSASDLQQGARPVQPATASPSVELPQNFKVAEATLKNLKPVGSVANNEGEGHASVDFPATSGRYVLVKWNLTADSATAFSVAEVAAFGTPRNSSQIIASSEDRYGARYADAKDGKTILDNKEIPAEGPESPAEGPPPDLPPAPPFSFIPEVVPTSP